MYNRKDRGEWESIFANVPSGWKTTPPGEQMHDCLDFFREHGVRNVLDMGCGIGRWSLYLAKNGFDVKGYDFSTNAISYAQSWAREEKADIVFHCCEITKFPFPDQCFDGFLAAMVLHNLSVKEVHAALDVTFEYLAKDGVFYALMNPRNPKQSENPTKNITCVDYTDEEIKNLFPMYKILHFKTYNDGTRAVFLKKP